jgi:5'-methylthioadenosine phosphorylase
VSDNLVLAVIGGSGLYDMPGLSNVVEQNISTPFGSPSSPVVIGDLEGKRIAFLSRHGTGHHISPTEVNYRANIYTLKKLGAKKVLSISACGSLREDYAPGHLVVPDQIFDNTKRRVNSFFENGMVAHVNVADPFCPDLSDHLFDALSETNATVHKGGTMITIEGPRFSTKAESHTFRSWGLSLIGMTTSPEAFLAREAELCYAVLAHVTDFDVWHTSESPVTVEMVVQILHKSTHTAQEALRILVKHLPDDRNCDCESALKSALITAPNSIPPATRNKLKLLIKNYLD